jgi:hypothetical protein
MKKWSDIFFILLFFTLISCDGIIRVQTNLFIKKSFNGNQYLSKFNGTCFVYFNLLEIEGVLFEPDSNKKLFDQNVIIENGKIDLSIITWPKKSKYVLNIECPGYQKIEYIFQYPALTPSNIYFELEKL